MKFTTGALAASAAVNLDEQGRILDYIKKYPSKEGKLAKKAYNRANIITLLIIFLVMTPLCVYTMISLENSINNSVYPDGATKEVRGHISLYENTFYYTDSSQKYEYEFEDYSIDDSYEPGEIILIYLDDNNNIVSVSHQKENDGLFVNIILMFVVPIVLLLLHAFVGRKTYCKWWNLYVQWYQKEIEPYCFQNNFEEIIADKKFYDVTVNIKDLSLEEQGLYKKYKNKNIFYSILLLLCIILTIWICTEFDLNPYSWIVVGAIIIYVLIFYILIDNCDVEMHRIKSGYYGK